jgi:hypothetical protein
VAASIFVPVSPPSGAMSFAGLSVSGWCCIGPERHDGSG